MDTLRAPDLRIEGAWGLEATRKWLRRPPPLVPSGFVGRPTRFGRIGGALSMLWRGGGWDRPEAARPPGSRAAVGEAGGFNAVQKLLTAHAGKAHRQHTGHDRADYHRPVVFSWSVHVPMWYVLGRKGAKR